MQYFINRIYSLQSILLINLAEKHKSSGQTINLTLFPRILWRRGVTFTLWSSPRCCDLETKFEKIISAEMNPVISHITKIQ